MSENNVLTGFYEISEYLVRREIVRSSKDFPKTVAFETLSIRPSMEAVEKAKDTIIWNERDISAAEKRLDYLLDEVERIRKCIKQTKKLVNTANTIIDIYNSIQGIDKNNSF